MKRRLWSKQGDRWAVVNGDPTWASWFKRLVIALNMFNLRRVEFLDQVKPEKAKG